MEKKLEKKSKLYLDNAIILRTLSICMRSNSERLEIWLKRKEKGTGQLPDGCKLILLVIKAFLEHQHRNELRIYSEKAFLVFIDAIQLINPIYNTSDFGDLNFNEEKTSNRQKLIYSELYFKYCCLNHRDPEQLSEGVIFVQSQPLEVIYHSLLNNRLG